MNNDQPSLEAKHFVVKKEMKTAPNAHRKQN